MADDIETILVVHGTFSAPAPKSAAHTNDPCNATECGHDVRECPTNDDSTTRWWEPNGSFCQALNAKLAERGANARCWAHLHPHQQPFSWTGANSETDRQKASVKLTLELDAIAHDERVRHFHIVAHSHGGNVVALALSNLPRHKLGKVIFLGTPFITTSSVFRQPIPKAGGDVAALLTARSERLTANADTATMLLFLAGFVTYLFTSNVLRLSTTLSVISAASVGAAFLVRKFVASLFKPNPTPFVRDQEMHTFRFRGDEAYALLITASRIIRWNSWWPTTPRYIQKAVHRWRREEHCPVTGERAGWTHLPTASRWRFLKLTSALRSFPPFRFVLIRSVPRATAMTRELFRALFSGQLGSVVSGPAEAILAGGACIFAILLLLLSLPIFVPALIALELFLSVSSWGAVLLARITIRIAISQSARMCLGDDVLTDRIKQISRRPRCRRPVTHKIPRDIQQRYEEESKNELKLLVDAAYQRGDMSLAPVAQKVFHDAKLLHNQYYREPWVITRITDIIAAR